MRRLTLCTATLFSLAILPCLSGCAAYFATAEVQEHRSIDTVGVRTVEVDTRNGSIEVGCEPGRKSADIDAVKFSRGVSNEDARTHAEEIEIDVARDTAHPDTLRIAAHWPEGDSGRSRGARLRLTLPPDAALRLKTSNGRVTVRQSQADVNAETSNGVIQITEVSGNVDVHTSNGRIELDRVGKGQVSARTSNGSIRATGLSGNVRMRTSNGSIDAELAMLPTKPEISAVSSNGHVTVVAPGKVDARLHLRTSNGAVHSDLGAVGTVSNLETGRNHLNATLNGGAGNIEIESSNGGVSFRSKAL